MATEREIDAAAEAIGREVMPWTMKFRSVVIWPDDYSDDEVRRIRNAAICALEAAGRVRWVA